MKLCCIKYIQKLKKITPARKNELCQQKREMRPEKELRGYSPNFNIHASVSDLYVL
jgi:hypothetical protein